MISVALPWRVPSEPPVPCARATSQFLTCTLGCASPAELPHRLHHLGQAAAVRRVVVAEPAPVGIERQLARPRDEIAVGHELAALPLGAEAQVLQRDQHGDGEAVVDGRVLDVRGLDPRLGERRRPRPDGARIRDVDAPAHLVLDRFPRPEQPHTRPREARGDLGPDHDDGAAPVGDDAAVEAVERVGDHRGVDDVRHRDDVAQQGEGIVLRVVRGRDLDPGELLARRPVLVHVPHRGHGVLVDDRRPVRELERDVRARGPVAARRGAGGHALGARPARERDQRHVALARRDRLRGMRDVNDVGRSARLRRVDVPELEPHVVGHGQAAEARRIARAEIAVDVVLREVGVGERAHRRLGVELRQRLLVRLARRMLVDTRDIGLALDGHARLASLPARGSTAAALTDRAARAGSIGVPAADESSTGSALERAARTRDTAHRRSCRDARRAR